MGASTRSGGKSAAKKVAESEYMHKTQAYVIANNAALTSGLTSTDKFYDELVGSCVVP